MKEDDNYYPLLLQQELNENMEDDYYPKSPQEELNEIAEAFYTLVSEEDIRKYEAFVEGLRHQGIADGAVKAPSIAPDFELIDQDDETVRLKELLKRGPVVVVFYRGKWCPQCNSTLMRYQRALKDIQAKGATLVAISPMLPDGTAAMASKRFLDFPVCSDLGNQVARKYHLTFVVPKDIRPEFEAWDDGGEDIPAFNGDDTWELPVPATYIIDQEGKISWCHIDNDPGQRAEAADIVEAIAKCETTCTEDEAQKDNVNELPGSTKSINRFSTKKVLSSSVRLFGKKKQSAMEYLSHYKL